MPCGALPWELSAPPANGRWQRGQVAPALYFADSEETVLAESARLIRELGAMPEGFLPRDLWRAEIDDREYIDLRDPRIAAKYKVPVSLRPTRSDWPNCQPIGERIAGDGHKGTIAPSAARANGSTVAVFPAGIDDIKRTAQRLKRLASL